MASSIPKREDPLDDFSLFRKEVADAKPVVSGRRVLLRQAKPKPVPLQLLKDEQNVLREALQDALPWAEDVEHSESLTFLRPGLPRRILRKLRGGEWVVQDELDLHGLRTDEAKDRFIEFLAECKRLGLRCVRIIHGKGLRSKNREPVLKNKVRRWLTQRDEILAFVEARPLAGGSGAVIVLLKSAIKVTSSEQ